MKKIFSLFLAMTAMVAVNAADFYLVGAFNGWSPANAVAFTEVSAGNYEVIVPEISGEGKVLGTTEGWLPQYGAHNAGDPVTLGGEPYVLKAKFQDSDSEPSNIQFGTKGVGYKNAKFALTVAGDQVSIAFISGEEYDPNAKPTYQIIGGSIGWDLPAAVQFEEVEGVLTAEVADMNGTFKIIKNRTWDEQWATNWETGAGLAMGAPYVMGAKTDAGEPANLAFANPFAGYKNAKFTLEVKEDGSMVLTLVSGEFYAVEADWHLPGTKLGWNCDVDQRFTPVEGEANTYELLAAEFGADFKVVFGNWGAEFGAPSEDAKWEINKEYTCAFKGGNIHAVDNEVVYTDCTIRLVVDYENVVVKITISSESVPSAVEDVVTPNTITKVIENGQMYILRDGVRYNALGGVVK